MEALVSILGFCIVFILPIVILIMLIVVYGHTRKTATQLDGIQSRIDLLLNTKQIDLSNLSIPRSLGSGIKGKLAMIEDRPGALSLIEDHLGVNRKQAEVILDRYLSEHNAGELFSSDEESKKVQRLGYGNRPV